MAFTDYASGASGSTGSGAQTETTKHWPLGKLKKSYTTYLSSKNEEIEEQKLSRRYYHGSHWTDDEIKALRKRKQPVVTFNRIARKIDGVVGILQARRQDPKAYARTPKHEDGADLATAVLRYICDTGNWADISTECIRDAAIEGIGGIELELTENGNGDKDISFSKLNPDGFFYDPRSFSHNFEDGSYRGYGKWLDIEVAKDLFPEKADELEAASDSELTTNADREQRWFQTDGINRNVRIVECWYKHKGEWCWSVFCGSGVLLEGQSPFYDDKGKTICKYIVFSAGVDHDGDRYGFVRNLKSANDEINHRRSKGLHELNSRRLIVEKGAVDNVEGVRKEAARPDGVIEVTPGLRAEFDDTARLANIEGAFKFLEDAKNEIENFGYNPALVGQGVQDMSGKAIQLQQQAGVAELGPFIGTARQWKLNCYRAFWSGAQRYWTGERYIRVTDDENLAQYIQINGLQMTPMGPALVNAIGELDVDIIIDEGPDTITIAQETHETLANILSGVGPALTPQQAQACVQIFLDTSSIPSQYKKKFREATEAANQPDPMQEQAKMAELQTLMEKARETGANADLKQAQAAKTIVEAQLHPQAVANEGMAGMMGQPQDYEVPAELQNAQAMADIEKTYSEVEKNRAAAYKTQREGDLAPQQMIIEQQNAAADRAIAARNADEDRKIKAKQTNGRR